MSLNLTNQTIMSLLPHGFVFRKPAFRLVFSKVKSHM